jgi:trehalose 6-phosphate phosphatase
VAAWADAAWSEELDMLRVRAEDKQAIRALPLARGPGRGGRRAGRPAPGRPRGGEGFAIHWGRKVLEVRPPVRMDKGRGIERLMTGAGMGCALYAGDDVTDIDAFRGLRDLVAAGDLGSALCVGVRSDETPPALEEAADVLVDGPIGVRRLLTTLAG